MNETPIFADLEEAHSTRIMHEQLAQILRPLNTEGTE